MEKRRFQVDECLTRALFMVELGQKIMDMLILKMIFVVECENI